MERNEDKGPRLSPDFPEKLGRLAKVDILVEHRDGTTEVISGLPDSSPVLFHDEFREELKNASAGRDFPLLSRDERDIYFSAIHSGGDVYYIGPMSTRRQKKSDERLFYRSHGIRSEETPSLRFFSFEDVLSITELLDEVLTGRTWKETELLYLNHLNRFDRGILQKDRQLFLEREEEANEDEEVWRHTYREERQLMDAVREGRIEDALRLSRMMDEDGGRLSERDLEHWRNLAIVGIALVSRAAIEGGLPPQTAYRISGYYIGKCDQQVSATHLLGLRDYAIRELTERVHERLNRSRTSSYTETCKTYIARHYREKIYLEDIAHELTISPTYLSKLFRKETGMRLQDYIIRIRVERAANLLRYSDRTLADIAQYVGFPSQSYLGKMFLKEMHATPGEYRNRHRTAEWGK